MEINQRFLHIRGKIQIDDDLNMQQDVPVIVTVTDIVLKDNNDGTCDRIFKAKLFQPDF